MKKLLILAALIFTAGFVFAQSNSISDPDPNSVGRDSAMQALR